MRLIRALSILLLVVLVASACSPSPGDDPLAAAPSVAASDVAPFDAVLIRLFGTSDTDAYRTDAERHAAELVVDCMEDAGFEFQIPPRPIPFEPPDPTDLDAARAEGFGIIAGFRHQIAQTDLAALQSDPNQVYLTTLTSAEIDRFFLTLDGVEAEPGQRQENAGCNGSASDQAYADWIRFFEALPNYTSLGEERDTHPDWLAARATWRDCMLDRGFDYAEPDAIRTSVISRMRDTVNQVYPGGQVPLVEDGGDFVVDPNVDILLEELVQFERAAAVANVECTEPIADQFQAVEREVQQGFVDRNRATIDELIEATK